MMQILQVIMVHCPREIDFVMHPVKTIATLASVAVLASSIFAISWVGLALLGY